MTILACKPAYSLCSWCPVHQAKVRWSCNVQKHHWKLNWQIRDLDSMMNWSFLKCNRVTIASCQILLLSAVERYLKESHTSVRPNEVQLLQYRYMGALRRRSCWTVERSKTEPTIKQCLAWHDCDSLHMTLDIIKADIIDLRTLCGRTWARQPLLAYLSSSHVPGLPEPACQAAQTQQVFVWSQKNILEHLVMESCSTVWRPVLATSTDIVDGLSKP